jgi:hypothetical protein
MPLQRGLFACITFSNPILVLGLEMARPRGFEPRYRRERD